MKCACGLRHDPIQCILPAHILEHMTESGDPELRRIVVATREQSAAIRELRATIPMPRPSMLATLVPGRREREVHDMRNRTVPLPGNPVRPEGAAATGDAATDEAYDFAGITWDFFDQVLGRNSIDNAGLPLVSSVHHGRSYLNAFWTGSQMVYGDGDGTVFNRFTPSLDVVAHEFSHGVTSYECDLVYRDEPGALNEHFSDVFGVLAKQWHLGEDVTQADWLIGADLITPAPTRKALRSMRDPGNAYRNDPILGDDPQRNHYTARYTGGDDNGGVHINSGIPNLAFYRAAVALGGSAWATLGPVWYRTLRALTATSVFADAKRESVAAARSIYGAGSNEERAVADAWQSVGV